METKRIVIKDRKNIKDEELAEAVFHCDLPMPAAEQRETFDTVLGETLEEDCSLDVVQSVQERLQEMIQEHKERKEAEPLTLSVRLKMFWRDAGFPRTGWKLLKKNTARLSAPIQSLVPGIWWTASFR